MGEDNELNYGANGLKVTVECPSGDIQTAISGIGRSGAQREFLGDIRCKRRSCGWPRLTRESWEDAKRGRPRTESKETPKQEGWTQGLMKETEKK